MLRQVYVQHRIVEAGAELCEMMLKRNGHFYVCGSARQVLEAGPWLDCAPVVRQSFNRVSVLKASGLGRVLC